MPASLLWFRRNVWLLAAVALCPVAFFVPNHLIRSGHHPPIGVYIGIMGGVAAAVTFRKEPSVPEKAVWIALITLLMIAEIRNLYIADAEQSRTFGAITSGLQAAAQGLDATSTRLDTTARMERAQFDATMAKSNKLLQVSKESLEHITGGNAYCYIVPLPAATTKDINWQLVVGNSGNVTLPTCAIHLHELPNSPDRTDDSWRRFVQGFNTPAMSFPNVPPKSQGAHFTQYSIQAGPNRKYEATITTPTHSFIETIDFSLDRESGGYVANCELRTFPGDTILKKGCDTIGR
jgi:hypothetical protein